ncbi:hypothetical protein SAMN04487947_1519 [Halogeometricum rufum]|uniref:Uncharacterized protein n=2 Tax=Halogeometricum TaxID=60846 RepID=A0A1I6GQY7_9EURY|nr:hypothetical protein [Halogeometricum rufum]SFR44457.1 hypothetical protein SAMN04487947_1519 [Halogeometricum rufum]
MSDQPSAPSRGVKAGVAVLCLLVLAYSVVVAGQILLGVLFCALVYGLFLAYYLLGAFVRLVDSVERIADALEGRADQTGHRVADGTRSRDDRSRSEGSRDHLEDRW